MYTENEETIARRAFLAQVAEWGTAGAAGFVATHLQPTAASAAAVSGMNLGTVTKADFARLQGSTFHILPASGKPVDVTLVQIRDLPSGYSTGKPPLGARRRPAFGVVFRSAKPVSLASATYTIKHDQLGTFTLFLGPVGQPKNGQFEAVFG